MCECCLHLKQRVCLLSSPSNLVLRLVIYNSHEVARGRGVCIQRVQIGDGHCDEHCSLNCLGNTGSAKQKWPCQDVCSSSLNSMNSCGLSLSHFSDFKSCVLWTPFPTLSSQLTYLLSAESTTVEGAPAGNQQLPRASLDSVTHPCSGH